MWPPGRSWEISLGHPQLLWWERVCQWPGPSSHKDQGRYCTPGGSRARLLCLPASVSRPGGAFQLGSNSCGPCLPTWVLSVAALKE